MDREDNCPRCGSPSPERHPAVIRAIRKAMYDADQEGGPAERFLEVQYDHLARIAYAAACKAIYGKVGGNLRDVLTMDKCCQATLRLCADVLENGTLIDTTNAFGVKHDD